MKQRIQFTRLNLFFLVTNVSAFGACIVLMALRGPNGPLVFITLGAGLAAAAKIGMAYHRTSKAASATAPHLSESSHP